MQNFVHRNNNGQGATQENDDLKLHFPGTSARGQHPQGTKGQSAKSAPRVKSEPDVEQDQPYAEREYNGKPLFYDTDASSIGRTSTTASMRQESAKRPAENEYQQDVDDPEEQQGSASEEDDGSGHEDADEPPEILDSKEQKLRELDRAVQSGGLNMPRGMGLPPAKGDSYPSTTSGNASIPDSRNTGTARNTYSQNMYNTPAQNLMDRQGFRRPGNVLQNQTPAYATDNTQGRTGPVQLISRPDSSNLGVAQDCGPSGFTFVKPSKPPQNPEQPARNTHQRAQSNTAVYALSTNSAQRVSVPTNGEGSYSVAALQQQSLTEKAYKPEKLPHHSKSIPNRQPPLSTRDQERVIVPARNAEALSHETEEIRYEPRNHPRIDHQELQESMDYDATEVHGMDYHTLKSEVFDLDPNAKDFKFGSGREDDALSDMISAISRSQSADQAHFFRSLTIEQWEQAGDWFLDQFSDVVGKLKHVRQEKRKAARAFEDEIEDRYKAVGQKREQIDGALSEMRESGGKVLQGTPKKMKTK